MRSVPIARAVGGPALALLLASLALGCHHLGPRGGAEWADPQPRPPGAWGATGARSQPGYGTGPQPAAWAWRSAPAGPGAWGWPGDALGWRAVEYALAQLGRPYCYGGTGPDCFDCSGLVYAAWRSAGRDLPRTSGAMREKLTPIAWSHAQPGDVVWRSGHVGLYVGNGWVIHAPQSGERVQYQPAQKYRVALRP